MWLIIAGHYKAIAANEKEALREAIKHFEVPPERQKIDLW
jgi:hypothetical protein